MESVLAEASLATGTTRWPLTDRRIQTPCASDESLTFMNNNPYPKFARQAGRDSLNR
jgi:hypothetical protein